ncbi:MAG: vWA domain-containing protein [Candidatus Nanohaloarchaea archaeon]
MKFAFTAEYTGLLLLLNGLIVLVFLYSRRKDKERAMKFGNYETLKKVAGGNFLRSNDLIMVARILAVTCLLVGLSSPVMIHEAMGAESDFVIAVDSSSSMFTSDIEPTRFEAAKDASKNFVSDLGNSSSIGLISFAGTVTEEQDLSRDRSLVQSRIDQQAEIGEEGGTAMGDAVATSASMLSSSERDRTVLLITDGRNTVGQSLNESASFAERQNVTVNTIGIGSSQEQEDFGMVQGENASRMEFPNLNREGLEHLSNQTGGESVFVSNREGLETAFVELEEQTVEEDISTWFFLLAGSLMVLEAFFRTTSLRVIP